MTDSMDSGLAPLTSSGTIMLKHLQQQHEMQMMMMQQRQAQELQMQQQYAASQPIHPAAHSPAPRTVNFQPASPHLVPVTPVSPASMSMSSSPSTPHTPNGIITPGAGAPALSTEASPLIAQVHEALVAQSQRLERLRQQQKVLMEQMQSQVLSTQSEVEQLHAAFNQLGSFFF